MGMLIQCEVCKQCLNYKMLCNECSYNVLNEETDIFAENHFTGELEEIEDEW